MIDGDTASAEGTLVSLEIWAVHFLRKDKFKASGCAAAGAAGAAAAGTAGLVPPLPLPLPLPAAVAAATATVVRLCWIRMPYCPGPLSCGCPQGRASVPLREVQRRRRVRGSWPLQDAPPGASLSLELSWTAAVGMY